jgi:hypothetical protein
MAKADRRVKPVACHHCGRVHPGLPTDDGFRLPDEVFALPTVERYLRTRSNPDVCTLDEARYFLRGILVLPFADRDGVFSWGVWAEVARSDHDAYLTQIEADSDGSSLPRFGGQLANAIPGYGGSRGLAVEVQLGGPAERPSLWLPRRSRHALAREQARELSAARHHQVLEACGCFDAPGYAEAE